jgi:hypothetical protein
MIIKIYTGLVRNVLTPAPLTILAVCIVLAIGMKGLATQEQDPYTDQETARLLKIIRNEQLRIEDPEKVGAAIATLGELRAEAAVDDLIKLITFRRTFPQDNEPNGIINELRTITRDGRYPAVGSLFEIGKPSLLPLVKLICDYDTKSLESVNALTAVMLIFREDPPAGVQYLKDAAEKASYPLQRQRLLSAAEKAKGPPPL